MSSSISSSPSTNSTTNSDYVQQSLPNYRMLKELFYRTCLQIRQLFITMEEDNISISDRNTRSTNQQQPNNITNSSMKKKKENNQKKTKKSEKNDGGDESNNPDNETMQFGMRIQLPQSTESYWVIG